jgi:hypothetical protein
LICFRPPIAVSPEPLSRDTASTCLSLYYLNGLLGRETRSRQGVLWMHCVHARLHVTPWRRRRWVLMGPWAYRPGTRCDRHRQQKARTSAILLSTNRRPDCGVSKPAPVIRPARLWLCVSARGSPWLTCTETIPKPLLKL